MTIHGLVGTIVFTAADRYEAMRSFYVETLGLPVRTDRAGHVSFAGDAKLTVAVHSSVDGEASDASRVVVNLGCGDIASEHARLRQLGVRCLRAPEEEAWGGWVATYSDPDGNTVQLLQLP